MDQDVTPALGRCPRCGERVSPSQLFCEGCGADLHPAPGLVGDPVDRRPVPEPDRSPGGPPTLAAPAMGHSGTLLDDPTAAGTDMARHSPFVTTDVDLTRFPTSCSACTGTIAPDGYCEQCGTAAPRPRDHWREAPAPWLAAVCDRGVRHARNEDAMAVAASREPALLGVVVVCDGVSVAPGSDLASLAAARAARDAVIAALTPQQDCGDEPSSGDDTNDTKRPASRAAEFVAAIETGGAAAQAEAAAAGASVPAGKSPPSCTFVAAVIERSELDGTGLIVTGWVGDSRAYWLPDVGVPIQLTEDDSWATEAIAHGMLRADAEAMPHAHAITKWLGWDAPDPVPRTNVMLVQQPGWLLVCSDGLWNYRSDPADLAALVSTTIAKRSPDDLPIGEPLTLAKELVVFAVGQGGHDNVTVGLVRFDPGMQGDRDPDRIRDVRGHSGPIHR